MAECKKLIKQGEACRSDIVHRFSFVAGTLSGYIPASKVLAKEVVNTRKAIARMYSAQAQLNSVSMGLSTSVGE